MSLPPPTSPVVVEVLARLVDKTDEPGCRMPSAGAYKLYYTAQEPTVFGMTVCNGKGGDAHISIWKIEATATWTPASGVPPPYTVIFENVRVEADGVDGNTWVMPVTVLDEGDRIVVRTDLSGVTFDGHGWKFLT